jgi:RNA polymerase sigma-70 factor (ECF subfamily)
MNSERLQTPADTAQPPLDWEAVYHDLLPRVYNFFRYQVGDDALAEDLTATTFMKAWRERARYRHDLSAFSTWLYSIARHVAIDHYRTHKPIAPLDAADGASDIDIERLVARRADAARLHVLLGRLPQREREIIALKYGAEMTNRAIATLTGLSESNVGTILHRTVQTLREQWEDTL